MKKLVQVGVDLIPSNGGIHKSTLQFSEAFGDSPILSFTQQREIPEDPDRDKPIRHFPLSKNKLLEWYGYSPRDVRRKAEAFAEGADILCCNIMLRHHACWTRSLAQRKRIPYWFVAHGQLDPHVYTYRAGIKKFWLRIFGRKILKDAKFVIFSTEREREKAKWFYDGTNTRVIHWPVELLDLSAKGAAKVQIRRQLRLASNVRVMLCLGRLHTGKCILETIKAFAMSKALDAHLVLVGPDGDIKGKTCVQLARDLGVGDRVHVIGPVYGGDKERYLLGADIYISLSRKENFGHTAAESLSAGNAVVLSPGNDLSGDLRRHKCGLFLEDDSIKTASIAITKISKVSNEELRLMGDRGRVFAEQNLSEIIFREKLQALALDSFQK